MPVKPGKQTVHRAANTVFTTIQSSPVDTTSATPERKMTAAHTDNNESKAHVDTLEWGPKHVQMVEDAIEKLESGSQPEIEELVKNLRTYSTAGCEAVLAGETRLIRCAVKHFPVFFKCKETTTRMAKELRNLVQTAESNERAVGSASVATYRPTQNWEQTCFDMLKNAQVTISGDLSTKLRSYSANAAAAVPENHKQWITYVLENHEEFTTDLKQQLEALLHLMKRVYTYSKEKLLRLVPIKA
jgi:hypothetical protein